MSKSGNSKAVRLPGDWPVEVEDTVGLRAGSERFIRERSGQRIRLSGVAGAMPGLRPPSPDERAFKERELPWGVPGGRSRS
ncbi:hypothetical protein [Thermaurantiacus sp.]